MKPVVNHLALLLLLSACSSIIEGRSQTIMVNTNPEGANCDFLRNGEKIASVTGTPNSAYIEKTKYDIKIECHKKGFETATFYNHSGAAGATFGNIVLGGGIGWAVDSATGSDNKYDSPVNITMVPRGYAAKAEEESHRASNQAQVIAEDLPTATEETSREWPGQKH
jgi:hypothetical protein